jgi:hypothetical protein
VVVGRVFGERGRQRYRRGRAADRGGPGAAGFHAGDRARVDALTSEAPARGWTLLFPQTHPYAGGPDHYAAYLASTDGFEVELVADPCSGLA